MQVGRPSSLVSVESLDSDDGGIAVMPDPEECDLGRLVHFTEVIIDKSRCPMDPAGVIVDKAPVPTERKQIDDRIFIEVRPFVFVCGIEQGTAYHLCFWGMHWPLDRTIEENRDQGPAYAVPNEQFEAAKARLASGESAVEVIRIGPEVVPCH